MLEPAANDQIVRLGAYLRVSTPEQAIEGLSPATQKVRIHEWANARFLYEPHVYEDLGYSGALGFRQTGSRPYRPQLAQMVADIEAGLIDAVAVYRLDRMFRSPSVCVDLLDNVFLKHEVPLYSVVEGLDSSTPHGRMMMQMLSVVAGYFLEWTRENISDNLQRRMEDGHPTGEPYGWELVEVEGQDQRCLARVEEEGRWLMLMKDMFLSGHSIGSIVEELHRRGVRSPKGHEYWRETVIRRLLQNPKHAGYLRLSDGTLIKASHHEDRYWELSDHHQICEKFERRIEMGPATAATPEFLLSGVLKCAHCGERMYGRRPTGRIRRRYRCCTARPKRGEGCTANSKPADLIEGCVIRLLREASQSDQVQQLAEEAVSSLLDSENEKLQSERDDLLTSLEKVKSDQEAWNQLYLDGEFNKEQLREQSDKLNDRRTRIEKRLAELREELQRHRSRHTRLERVRERLQDFDALWDEMDIEERREAVHTVIESATLEHHDDGSATLTVTPYFLEPRSFEIPHLHKRVEAGAGVELSLRQMALLKLHQDGLDAQEIAKRWGITVQGVRTQQSGLRKQLGVESLDEAVPLAQDAIANYQHVLPLDGRMLRTDKSEEHSILTDRQRQILRLVLNRHKAPKIARDLGISQDTVYVHLHQIRGRLGVTTDRAAAEKAVYLGLIEGDLTEDVPTLSPRQLALLKHISDGRTVREIARLWECAESCVHGVARQVRDRLAINDLNEAARLAEDQIKANLTRLPLTGRLRRPVDKGEGAALTKRQRQMLQGIREGLTYAQLGQRYGLAEPTVTGHLRKARDMLGAKRSLEAAQRAEELGLL